MKTVEEQNKKAVNCWGNFTSKINYFSKYFYKLASEEPTKVQKDIIKSEGYLSVCSGKLKLDNQFPIY